MRPAPRHARRREVPAWLAWAVVAGLTGASAGLGFFDLTKRSLWLDEGYTWITADQKLGVIFAIARQQGWHLIPYYLLIHAMISLFGDSSFVMRAPSVIAGALSVPLLYMLVRRLGGRMAGLYACVLYVCSEPFVYWQQNARDYALVLLFVVASTLALVVGQQSEKLWPFLVWAVVTGAGCYTHPEVLFLVPPQLIVVMVWARSNRTRLIIGSITGVGVLAGLPVLGQAAHSGVYQISPLLPPTYGSATEISAFLASAAGTPAPVTAVDHALLGITFALVVIGVGMLGADVVDRGCTDSNMGLALSITWLVMPMCLAWVASETGHPSFLDRYVILSLPACAATVALVAVRVEPRALGLFIVAYVTIFRGGVLVNSYHYPIDDYRGATRDVLAETKPGDCIAFVSNAGRMLFDYYDIIYGKGNPWPAQVLPPADDKSPFDILVFNDLNVPYTSSRQSLPYVAATSRICTRIFLFISHAGSPTGSPNSVEVYASLVHLQGNLGAYYKVQATRSYPGIVVQTWNRVHVAGGP